MSKKLPIQYGFNGGEVTPRMETRFDIEGRALGAQEMTNWFPNLQGPAETIPGFEHIFPLNENYARIFPLPVVTYTAFAIVVSTAGVVIVDSMGPIRPINLVTNGHLMNRTGWASTPFGDAIVSFISGGCIMTSGPLGTDFSDIAQNVTVAPGVPHRLEIAFAGGIGAYSVSLSSTNLGPPDIFSGTYYGEGNLGVGGLVSPTNLMYITIRVGGIPGPTQIRAVTKVGIYDETVAETQIVFPSPWSNQEDVITMQTAQIPGEAALIMTSANIEPYRLKWDPQADTWEFTPAPIYSKPPGWQGINWPVAVEFFEGRMYMGGTEGNPETFWASASNDYYNMYKEYPGGEEPLPADPFSYKITQFGKIRWMKGLQNLLIGTENAEYLIDSEDGVIMPGDVRARRQSAYGSTVMQAVDVGNKVLYVSPDGRKIRSVGYEWTEESWTSKDLTFGAEHITTDISKIQHLSWSLNPRNWLLAPTLDGKIIGATYDPDTGIIGFFRIVLDGYVWSICSLDMGGTGEIWAVVSRTNMPGGAYIEKITGPNNINIDSYEVLNYSTPLAGGRVPHLAGFVCKVIVDGKLHPDVVPNSLGEFALNYPAYNIKIGIAITGKLRTLSRDDQTSTGISTSGSAASADKRWNKAYIRTINSDVPKINGQQPPTTPELGPNGEIPNFETGDHMVSLRGFDHMAKITIEQTRHLPMVVGGIFGELTQN